MLRHNIGPSPTADPDDVRLNLWAVQIPEDGIVEVTFDNCRVYNITPEDLVGDNYILTQDLAIALHAGGAVGVMAPSAALPGTENVALFGVRFADDYLGVPVTADDIPTGHLTDGARGPREVWPLVRHFGTPHAALDEWQASGVYPRLTDPIATRW
jgi:hypothetical protein